MITKQSLDILFYVPLFTAVSGFIGVLAAFMLRDWAKL
jgi:hypothetical protein